MAASPLSVILYAPGINELSGGGTIDEVSQRIARALDHRDDEIPVTYKVRVSPTEPYAEGKAFAEVREITRCPAGGQPEVTHRVYNLDYHAALANEQPEKNLFTQGMAVAFVWVWMFRVYLKALFSGVKSIGSKQKFALFVGGFLLLLLTAYLAFIFVTVAQTAAHQIVSDHKILAAVKPLVPGWLKPIAKPSYQSALAAWHFWKSYAAGIVVLAGVIGFSFESARRWLKNLVNMFLGFCRYLDGGLGRSVCTGKFNDLLEHILEQSPARVDILAYSMGSLIALDALFPEKGNPNRRTGKVATLTTIGCPFDLVRTFWPDYFASRIVAAESLKWINVFSPVDLFGSNFANEDGAGVAPSRGINATDVKATGATAVAQNQTLIPKANLYYDHAGRKELKTFDALFLGAYQAHAQYWVCGDTRAESCFNLLVPELYPESVPPEKDKQTNPPAAPNAGPATVAA